MDYNYHTHTPFCHHASEDPEEYVKRALECGITKMGFSDHFPFRFPDGFEKSWRIQTTEAQDYVSLVRELGEKYKGIIDIKLGFEMEYYPDLFGSMISDARAYGADYLILGQHFINSEWDYPKNVHSVLPTDSVDMLVGYVDAVVEAMGVGVFTYVAHPDIINFTGDIDIYKCQMRRICEASCKYDIPLEINFLGIREKRIYPRDTFFELVGQTGAYVTFGLDAHKAEHAYDGQSLAFAKEIVEKYSLNYIGAPKLKPII